MARRQWDRTENRGKCPICGRVAKLDPYHITSQDRAEKTSQEWLMKSQGNIVHICRKCHDQTTASRAQTRFEKKPVVKPAEREYRCGRCGRTGHNRRGCYAETRADGSSLWKPGRRRRGS